MVPGHGLSRDEAARLLGVAPDAGAAEIRRAFRLWAVWAHPDHGGSAESFAELRAARDRLLQPEPVPTRRSHEARTSTERDRGRSTPDVGRDVPLRPRRPWSEVLVMPSTLPMVTLAIAAILSVLAILAAVIVAMPWGVVPAAVASALWCVAVSRTVLRDADHGHVIVTRSVAWVSVTVAQLSIAAVVGIPVVEVLPVLALPFVLAIALVNPAAGLWRASRVNVR